jgi:hypothetical protein
MTLTRLESPIKEVALHRKAKTKPFCLGKTHYNKDKKSKQLDGNISIYKNPSLTTSMKYPISSEANISK